jgi:ATPase subunit of ABC transporter with duplicated ATPase domains
VVLEVRDLGVEVGGRTIVDGVTFSVRAGEKVGLVGRNGAGKTTLFGVLGGDRPPHRGTVRRVGALGYLSQDPRRDRVSDAKRALSHVLSGRGLDAAEDELEKLRLTMEEHSSDKNVQAYSRAQERFEHAGGYRAESEARAIAAGLGLSSDRLDLPLRALSGGQRRRVELTRILFAGSDLLLLDEPTNHLDADAKAWLMNFLRTYRGALLVVSHDLALLDQSITRVLHLDRAGEDAVGTLFDHKGTYSQYLVAHKKEEARLGKLADRQASDIVRLSRQADSMRGQTAKRARVAKNLDRRVDQIRSHQVIAPTKKRSLTVRFPKPPAAGRTVLEAADLAKSFGPLDVFEDVTFSVGRGERLLILGLNGAGKTTLLRILAGISEADLGTLTWGLHTSVGYYAQEHEGIEEGKSLLAHMRETGAAHGDTMLRGLLGMFGLSGDKANQDAHTLSGGEKTKLALAQLCTGAYNVLLLDEPTNNLDPPSRTAIASSLASWPGTMLVVSHDAEFVRALEPDRVLLMPDATIDHWHDEMLELVELA